MQIVIDEEFRGLIPPLSAEERQQLERNVQSDGCRDPLVVWSTGNILLDGHNRYEICERLSIGYRTTGLDFSSRDAAKEWILRNQLGRRNLSDLDRIAVVRQLEPYERAKAKERQKTSTGGPNPQLVENLPQADEGKTRDHLAKLAGVSGKTYEAGVKVLEKGTPKLQQAVRDKDFSISKASFIAHCPPDEQDAVAEAAMAGDKDRVRKAVNKIQARNSRGRGASPKRHRVLAALDELCEMVNRPFSQVPIVHIRSKVAEVKSLIEKHFGVAEGEQPCSS